jgi:hypothetical protein
VDRLTPPRWWARVIGRRGEFLLFLTLLDLLYGLSLLHPAPYAGQSPTIRFLIQVMPLPLWGALWLVVGVTCLTGAFGRRDRAAFAAAASLKVLWGSMFLIGWVAGVVERGWVASLIWLAFALFVVRIASWPEPSGG